MNRLGCARFQLGEVLVEKRLWTMPMAVSVVLVLQIRVELPQLL